MNKKITNEHISHAVEVLRQGGVVAFPTDTSYGFAVDATSNSAIRKLYVLKGRDFNSPVHVIPPSVAYVGKVAAISVSARKLIKEFWPGPLTLVLPLKVKDSSFMRIKGPRGLGFRRPANGTALKLAGQLGRPITATSANVSGKPDNYTVTEIKRQFKNKSLTPDYYLDAGKLPKITPSTIVFLDKKHVTILRQGPVSERAIRRAIKK